MARRALAVALLAAALAAPAARADGDPASDVLLSIPVFYPFDVSFPQSSKAELNQTVHSAKVGGYPVRVALIPRRTDLGVVTALWKKPQQYSHFLAQELAFVYRGRLLIVMPNGYGMYWCTGHGQGPCAGIRPLKAEKRVLATLPTADASGKDLAAAATVAVTKLAAANGVKVTAAPPPGKATGRDTTGDRLKIGAGALTLLVLAGGFWFVRRWRRS